MADAPVLFKDLYADRTLRENCSGFFKHAIQKLDDPKLKLPDKNADGLIEEIEKSENWVKIGAGPAAGTQAADFAAKGYLVVALLTAAEHLAFRYDEATGQYDIPRKAYSSGHMAIVLPGPTRDGSGYPYVISGGESVDGQSDGSKSVWGVWRKIDAIKVRYYRSANVVKALAPGPATQ